MTDAEQLEALGNQLIDFQVHYRAASLTERKAMQSEMNALKSRYSALQLKIIKDAEPRRQP